MRTLKNKTIKKKKKYITLKNKNNKMKVKTKTIRIEKILPKRKTC